MMATPFGRELTKKDAKLERERERELNKTGGGAVLMSRRRPSSRLNWFQHARKRGERGEGIVGMRAKRADRVGI